MFSIKYQNRLLSSKVIAKNLPYSNREQTTSRARSKRSLVSKSSQHEEIRHFIWLNHSNQQKKCRLVTTALKSKIQTSVHKSSQVWNHEQESSETSDHNWQKLNMWLVPHWTWSSQNGLLGRWSPGEFPLLVFKLPNILCWRNPHFSRQVPMLYCYIAIFPQLNPRMKHADFCTGTLRTVEAFRALGAFVVWLQMTGKPKLWKVSENQETWKSTIVGKKNMCAFFMT